MGIVLSVVVGLLSVLPLLVGVLRVLTVAAPAAAATLATYGVVAPDGSRFFDVPVAILIHVVSANGFAILMGLALLWRHQPQRHRPLGKAAAAAGVLMACSGLWLTVAVPPAPSTLVWMVPLRLLVGTALLGCLALALRAVWGRQRDLQAHRLWMARSAALGFSAATQVLTAGGAAAVFGEGGWAEVFGMSLGWAINLAIAEALLRPARTIVSTGRAPGEHRVSTGRAPREHRAST